MSEKTYRMPQVALGDVVYWRHAPDSEPAVAIVTAVGGDQIDLAICFGGCHNLQPKQAVRHAGHPDHDYPVTTETGVWEHRPAPAAESAENVMKKIPLPQKAR